MVTGITYSWSHNQDPPAGSFSLKCKYFHGRRILPNFFTSPTPLLHPVFCPSEGSSRRLRIYSFIESRCCWLRFYLNFSRCPRNVPWNFRVQDTSVNIHSIPYHIKIKHNTDLFPRLGAPSLQYLISEVILSIVPWVESSLGEILSIRVSYAKSSVDVIVQDGISGIITFNAIK